MNEYRGGCHRGACRPARRDQCPGADGAVTLDFSDITHISLDGESTELRQARRLRNWTPVAIDPPNSARPVQQ
ncbi:MAG: hypothetical protein ACHQIL_01820 [Steroidobacterales bacterium]